MKKLLFTFFGLILLGSTCLWGATTVTKNLQNNDLKWTPATVYQSFQLNDIISVETSGQQTVGGSNYNGLYHTNNLWYIYQGSPTKGKTTIRAKSGYIIQSITLTYSTNSKGSLQDVATSSIVTSAKAYTVNADSVSLIVYNASTTDMAKLSIFSVTYAAKTKATAITMEESMTVSVGNHFQIGITTPDGAYCDWTSGDASKVAVDQNGIITAKAVTNSPVTIMAKGNGVEKTCAVTVVAKTGTDIIETFSQAETSDSWKGQSGNAYSVNGDNDLLHWVMRSIRRATGDKVDGVQATRISYNSGTNFIAYNNSSVSGSTPMEGGVKRVSFKWIAASGSNPVVFDVDNTSAPLISHHTYLPASSTWTSTQTFTKDVNMAKNAQFRIKLMNSNVSAVAATLNIGPLTITPYLLYTTKSANVNCKTTASYDLKTGLIDNTDDSNITFTATQSTAGWTGKITDGVLDLRDVSSKEDIKVTATWGQVSTTMILKVTEAYDAVSEVSLNVGSSMNATAGNKFQVIATITPSTANQILTWKSSAEDVVCVDQKGIIEIKKEGEATITATAVNSKSASCTINASSASSDESFVENFDAYGSITAFSNNIVTKDNLTNGISWMLRNGKRDGNDKIGSDQGIELQYRVGTDDSNKDKNYIVYKDAKQEGGVKRVAFQWRAVDATKVVYFDVDGTASKEPVYSTKLAANADFANAQQYSRDLNMTKNYQFRIRVADLNSSNIVFGPLTITPYLLFKQKTADVNCKTTLSYDLKTIPIINNTGETPTFSITSETGCTSADIKDGVLDLTKVIAKGDINITATWGSVTTTTKLVVTDAYAAVPTGVTLSENEALTATVGNHFQIIGTVAPTTANPKITWESSAPTIVDVDQNGIVDVKAAGEATITATAVNGVKKTCKITVSTTTDRSIEESFSVLGTKDEWKGESGAYPVNGDDDLLHWIMRSINRAEGDKHDGVQWTRIRYNNNGNYIAYSENAGTTPKEGGVKRISFQWVSATANNPVVFDVDNNGQPGGAWIRHKTYLPKSSAWQTAQTFTKDVNMAKNVQFRIKLMATGVDGLVPATISISPLTITPYLLFTNKAVSATNGFYKFNDDDLINNTGTTLAQANFEVSNAEAASVEEDGTIKSLQDNQTITLTAKWGDVTTTTKLTTHLVAPTVTYANPEMTKNIGDAVFRNNPTTYDGATISYASSNSDVAAVDPTTGDVTIKNGGTVKIFAHIDAAAPYLAKDTFYTLDIGHTIGGDSCFAEYFDSIDVGTKVSLDVPKVFGGNGGVYRWKWTNIERNSGEKIGSYQSPKLINNYGEIAMTDVAEGGIKEVAFRYKPKTDALLVHFYVKVGDKEVEMARVGTANTMNFAHQFNMADSVGLSIYHKATDNPQQTHILLDTIKIVPYLLYTKKVVAASAVNNPYTNTDIIDNTTGDKPVYSISCPTDVAEINSETGAVTIHKSDTVTVTATWGKVKTTYTLQMQAKPIPSISFAAPELNKDLLAGKFTNKLTTPAGIGDTTYTSSNEDVATVDANTGEITLHSIGETRITVNIDESEQYAATSKSYDLTVGFTPTVGTFWTETFSAIPVKNGYKDVDTVVIGDSAVYNWTLKNYAHRSGDLVGNQSKYYGICKSENGYIKTNNMEGGVKCIAFDWSPKNSTGAIDYSVKVGENKYEYVSDPRAYNQIYKYARLTNADQNVNLEFKLENFVDDKTSAYIVFGKMTVVPYILYTRKNITIKAIDYVGKGVFVNDKFINNTDEEVTYSIISSNSSNIAQILPENEHNGKVTILGGGDVTVQAKWGNVTTTYNLHITKETTTVTLEGAEIDAFGTYTPAPVAKIGETKIDTAKFTYNSTNKDVVDVVGNKLVFKRVGETKITATLVEGAVYQSSTSAEVTLKINEPTGDKYWKETFSKLDVQTEFTTADATKINGDSSVYKWQIRNYRHHATYDVVNGEKSVSLRLEGLGATSNYIAFNGNKEWGGVKAFFFNWRPVSKLATKDVQFTVRIDPASGTKPLDTTYTFTNVSVNKDIYYSCAKVINKPVDGMFRIGVPVENDSVAFGPITIMPYLLYTKRDTTIDATSYPQASSKFTNDKFIDNTEGGAITYAIEDADNKKDIAVIEDATSGAVTIKGAGIVKVIASWEGVSTSYTLTINPKPTPEIVFEDTIVNMNTPAFIRPAKKIPASGLGTAHYATSDKSIVKVDASGLLTIVGAGTVTISIHYDESESFMATDASFKVIVNDPMEAAYVEDFKKVTYSYDETKEQTITGKYDTWVSKFTRREGSATYGLTSSNDATWFHNSKGSYLKTKDVIEGGIKRVRFLYNRQSPDNRTIYFVVAAGDEKQNKDTVIKVTTGSGRQFTPDSVYYHNFMVKKNVALSVSVPTTSNCYLVMGDVKITPYLRFKGEKVMNIDLNKVTEVNLNDTIYNNTENGTINFAVDNFETDVAPTINAGVVDFTNVKKGGKVYISATWAENSDVKTTLVINTTITPEVSFAIPAPAAQNLINGSYTNVLSVPTGAGAVTYYSSNTNVATVDKNTGEVTFLIAGNTTITAKVAASDIYKKAEKSYNLTINGYTPAKGKFWTETFSNLPTTKGYVGKDTAIIGDSAVYNWSLKNYAYRTSDKVGNTDGYRGICKSNDGYLKTTNMEGGIKYIGFDWSPKNSTGLIDYSVKVGNNKYEYASAAGDGNKIYRYERFVNANENVDLEFKLENFVDVNTSAYIVFGKITIVPYLLYTHKSHTMNMNAGATYKNDSLIDNRDNATAISFKSSDEKVATVVADGTVTALKAGKVTITAEWGKVSTTYELTIVAKTTITLVRNDGTSDVDVVENNVGDPMPAIRPTRAGYRFNAYWTDDQADEVRFTVTRLDTNTVWVAGRQIGQDKFTDKDRKWIYSGPTYTFYAQWAPERTITFDNQGADAGKAGTESIVTAYCPNNNTTRLTSITKPEKTDANFVGYYTEAEGKGIKLIDVTGAFIKDVEGYTDTVNNWVKDESIKLYAYWASTIPVAEPVDVKNIPAQANVEIQEGGTIKMNESKELGDVAVEVGGAIEFKNSATLTVNNLTIQSTMGGTGTSGQITGATGDNLHIIGDVYYDLTLADDANRNKWHAFTVPFDVSTADGITNAANNKPLVDGKDFRIYEYDGATRAQGKYGWKQNTGTLVTGTFYMMTVNGDVMTFRMKTSGSGFSIASNEVDVTYHTGSGAGTDFGWNGIGNSQLDYRSVDQMVQIYDIENNIFEQKAASEVPYSVGTPFFYQADDKTSKITLDVPSAAPAPMRAVSAEPKNIIVTLADANYTDRLFISSTTDATYEYQIGKDLVKMTMTSTPAVPQIFAKAYDTKLCVIDIPMAGDEAHYDLSLYAPKTGEYTLNAEKVEGYEVYLTDNGCVVWNLSKNDFSVSLDKGNNDTYGLVLKKLPNTPTGMQNTQCTMQGVQKFIYDNQFIINREGKMYNGVGALVK